MMAVLSLLPRRPQQKIYQPASLLVPLQHGGLPHRSLDRTLGQITADLGRSGHQRDTISADCRRDLPERVH